MAGKITLFLITGNYVHVKKGNQRINTASVYISLWKMKNKKTQGQDVESSLTSQSDTEDEDLPYQDTEGNLNENGWKKMILQYIVRVK
jgi:hypothetical protein